MKSKLSGPAIFMYSAIVVMIFVSSVCFVLHYGKIFENGIVLWVGVVAFMILYHFGLRILMGNLTNKIKIDYTHPWYTERKCEKSLYKLLKVRKWKDKVLTFEPEKYDFKKRTLCELATTMAKSELDHWINEIISILSILFSVIWGEFWIFSLTAFLAMLFDAQFIIVQRYNRPIVLRLMCARTREDKRATALHKI